MILPSGSKPDWRGFAPRTWAADRWRGITVGEFEQRQLRVIREELDRAHAERVAPAVAPKQMTPIRRLRADR
jgi:hypothetical protein